MRTYVSKVAMKKRDSLGSTMDQSPFLGFIGLSVRSDPRPHSRPVILRHRPMRSRITPGGKI
eukprot:8861511-Pyramimonas_sp.AAC.1